MTGGHDFCDLTKELTPERRERIEARAAEIRAQIALRKRLDKRTTTRKALNDTTDASRPTSASKRS